MRQTQRSPTISQTISRLSIWAGCAVLLVTAGITQEGHAEFHNATRRALAAADQVLSWRPIHQTDRRIRSGSPLDFSKFFDTQPAGANGPVRVSASGDLITGPRDNPKRMRFHCGSLAWSPASGSFPDKATADVYAEQMRLQGYNLARFHFVDAILMSGRKKDFSFDPEQLDRFHYLLAALKRNGIYWMIDIHTSQNGAIGNVFPHRWIEPHSLKLDVHFKATAKRHWQKMARMLIGAKNKYTGSTIANDPALAVIITTNEGGIEFANYLEENKTGRAYAPIMRIPFNRFLKQKYKTDAALKSAWRRVPRGESLRAMTVALPDSHSTRGPRMRDFQQFAHTTELNTFRWQSETVRQLGFNGPISAFNNMPTTAADLSRGELELVTMNSYHDDVLSFEPGTTINQDSSLADDLAYLRELSSTRWAGRPFIVTEHNHMFWNRHRHQSGLLAPAMAALQNWDGLCRHGTGPIDLATASDLPHKRRILPYSIGTDPISRAAETLTALVFRRGDAQPIKLKTTVSLNSFSDVIDDGQAPLPVSITKLALITQFALTDQHKKKKDPTTSPNRLIPESQ
ncbi:MAG: beta-galactosidase, partial [Pseudomonadota bacterium]